MAIKFEVNQQAGKKIPASYWQKWLKRIEQELKLKKSLEISVAVVGDQAIKKLNKQYRRKDKVTDVLSFAEFDDLTKTPMGYLGEIIICYPQAVRQAAKARHSVLKEFQILFTHGFMHLLGYDHEQDDEAEIMEGLEKKILGFLK